jgi:hypothetical protein
VTEVTSDPDRGILLMALKIPRCPRAKSEAAAQFYEARHSGTRQGKGLA